MKKKPISLSTIMSQKVQSLQNQRELISTGVVTSLSGERKSLALKVLKGIKNPIQIDIHLTTSLQSLTDSKVTIKLGSEHKSPTLDIEIADESHFKACREAILDTLVPLPSEEIKKALASISTLMKKPYGETAADQSVRIKALTSQLLDVPADITLYAMREIVDTKVEFPVWSDFAKIVNHRKRNRECMLNQLDKLYHKKLLGEK